MHTGAGEADPQVVPSTCTRSSLAESQIQEPKVGLRPRPPGVELGHPNSRLNHQAKHLASNFQHLPITFGMKPPWPAQPLPTSLS